LVDDDWEGAMTEFRKAEVSYPLNPKILQQISLCLNSLGRSEEALAYLEKAHNVEPENTEIDRTARLVRFEYGLKLEKQGKWNEALSIFQDLKLEDPEEAKYFFHEAYCLQNLWKYKAAVELYIRGLRLDPQTAWGRINLATCLYALSRHDEAAQQWEILVAESASPEYIYNLGLARIRQWRLKEGWKLIGQAANAGFKPAQVLRRSRRNQLRSSRGPN
jgi:tetratricopeptide (TPR) repeat protein